MRSRDLVLGRRWYKVRKSSRLGTDEKRSGGGGARRGGNLSYDFGGGGGSCAHVHILYSTSGILRRQR